MTEDPWIGNTLRFGDEGCELRIVTYTDDVLPITPEDAAAGVEPDAADAIVGKPRWILTSGGDPIAAEALTNTDGVTPGVVAAQRTEAVVAAHAWLTAQAQALAEHFPVKATTAYAAPLGIPPEACVPGGTPICIHYLLSDEGGGDAHKGDAHKGASGDAGMSVMLDTNVFEDPGVWGSVIADMVGHVANAYAQGRRDKYRRVRQSVLRMLFAELDRPTDTARPTAETAETAAKWAADVDAPAPSEESPGQCMHGHVGQCPVCGGGRPL